MPELAYFWGMGDKIKLNRLKEILAREDKTTTWLAERIGKSRVVVSNYVNNNSQPSIETLFQIAAAFQAEGIPIQPREFVAEGDSLNMAWASERSGNTKKVK